MKLPRWAALIVLLFVCGTSALSAATAPARHTWTIDGVTREALVYVPANAKETPAPVIFLFHGHGGNMQAMVRRWALHELWPEAIVVCPQGLNTKGRLTDPEGRKPGWQHTVDQENGRDLKLFDTMLASLQADFRVDAARIYATGHSNGGAFTYLLWAVRGDVLAAIAPCAAALTPDLRAKVKPKPVFHLAGEKDPLVKFEWQRDTMDFLRKLNQCGEGAPWGPPLTTQYGSRIGAPVVTYIHPGGHEFPPAAASAIVKFFREHAQPPAK